MTQQQKDPIRIAGCYDGINGDWVHPRIYHASDRVSRSRLYQMLSSPAAYQNNDFSGSRATFRGDCAHALVLEPSRFLTDYAFPPSFESKSKQPGKKIWEAFTRSVGWVDGQPTDYAKTIVGYDYNAGAFFRDDCDAVRNIGERIDGLPKVRSMLQGPGVTEGTYCWDENGIRLRCRPDRRIKLADGSWVLIDFKTSTDASWGDFSRSIAKWGYHFQAAMYLEGVSQATDIEHTRFLFVVASTSLPCEIQLYELDRASIEKGRELYHRALTRLGECLKSGSFPDDSGQLRSISLPSYAFNQ